MNVRTAAYLAMALHFTRKVLRRVLTPYSRELHTGNIKVDQLVVAVPTDVTPGLVVAVAVVNSGTPWKDAMKFREVAQRHLDKCTVSIIDRDALVYYCDGRKALCYSSVPEILLSSNQSREFGTDLASLNCIIPLL